MSPCNIVQWDFVQNIVWHTTPKMRDRKFLLYYRISFKAFNNLVFELKLFLQS
ncbi:hypothetical protein CY35_13G084400 [Sphagnum magellanicum]|nr:hypothetical protein CY35_13G084400 [Sphagnum magellanicum]